VACVGRVKKIARDYSRPNLIKKVDMRFLPDKEIPGVILIEPTVFADERGFFYESYQKQRFDAVGIPYEFVQDNHSRSCKGVLRGLHYQVRQPQGKLVRAVSGEIFDVVVDIRRSSLTFGMWVGVYLSAENKRMLWVPPGFAHGFYVISEWAEVLYKATDYYAPQWERTLLWNDPRLNIEWPVTEYPIISPKDAAGLSLREADLFE
jgi:dTDP-4-dehydrorhamnose 3,5-epimerase